MKKALDIFSKQHQAYKKYRPTYPFELYQEILQHVRNKDVCWDCATGNGQVAAVLANHFEKVYATDLSKEQLDAAVNHPNIIYRQERAEASSFEEDKFDLITVAQAIHWFDMEAFNKELYRVGKNGGIVAVWGYGLLRIDQLIDQSIDQFYKQTIGSYWNKERKFLENAYEDVLFNFEQLNTNGKRQMTALWDLNQLEGFFNSWSAVQHYKDQNQGVNPVKPLITSIKNHWGEARHRPVNFPVYLKVGRIVK